MSIAKIIALVAIICLCITIVVLLVWLTMPSDHYTTSKESYQETSTFQIPEGNQTILYLFYSPNCSHCKNLHPIWDQLSTDYQDDEVSYLKVDATQKVNQELVAYYNITKVPTIILFQNNTSTEFNESRTLKNLQEFLKDNVK